MNHITVIIPNYNGAAFLRPCLESLDQQTMKEFTVIIVDNGSTDNSLTWIAEHYPQYQTIALEENKGFSVAVNVGILASITDYVVLMNTDTVADPDWLFHLLKGIQRDNRLFSCSSKMIQYHEPTLIDDAGDNYTLTGWAFQNGRGLPEHKFNKQYSIFSSCAGAAIYRREVFERIGLFDETFFAYLEDVDVGYRALLFGYRNGFCPEAKILHIGSATTGGGYSEFKVRLSSRNNVFMLRKNMPLILLVINSPFIILGILIMFWSMKKRSYGEIYLKGRRFF